MGTKLRTTTVMIESPSPRRQNSDINSSDSDEFGVIKLQAVGKSSKEVPWSPPKTLASITSPIPN